MSFPKNGGNDETAVHQLGGINWTKWGSVQILNSGNFAAFDSSIRDVLSTAGVWPIVDGMELKPKEVVNEANLVVNREEIRDWKQLNERAIIIISGSVSSELKSESFRNALNKRDAPALWNEISALNLNTNKLFTAGLRKNFNTMPFNPDKITIASFHTELSKIQKALQGTERPLSEADVLERILTAVDDLPREKHDWHQARLYCILNSLPLASTLQILGQVDKIYLNATESANVADHKNRGNNKKWRGGRTHGANNCGRGGRGVTKNGHRGRGGFKIKGHSNRSSPRRTNANTEDTSTDNVAPNECGFCHKPGHWQKDCHARSRALKAYFDEVKRKQQHGNLASASRSEYKRDDYPCSNINANIVIERTLMSVPMQNLNWKIDSGATKHFSGLHGDFSGLKRWTSPRYITTADGNTCTSDGYGLCKIGDLVLKDVWYVPAFKGIRLISVGALNRDGIKVVFEDSIATANKGKDILFTAPLIDGLFQISNQSITPQKSTQHSFSAHQSGCTSQIHISNDEMSRLPSNDSELWHSRLGHASYKTISRLPNIPNKPKPISKGENACEACLAGKMKETFSKKTDNRTSKLACRLHADISGKIPTSIRGYNYFLIVIDDASRCGWIRLLRNKSTTECLPAIKEIVTHLQLSS
ncbi:hypothetical protein K3495_g14419, partial [Podosphaera aphanis]